LRRGAIKGKEWPFLRTASLQIAKLNGDQLELGSADGDVESKRRAVDDEKEGVFVL
jgi:hypothetical protein